MKSLTLSVQADAVRNPAGAGRPWGDAPMDQPVPGRGGGAAASAIEPRGGWGATHGTDGAGGGERARAAYQRQPQGKPQILNPKP